MWSQTSVKQNYPQTVGIHQSKTSEMLAYQLREHNKMRQTEEKKKGETHDRCSEDAENAMQEDRNSKRKGCKKSNIYYKNSNTLQL